MAKKIENMDDEEFMAAWTEAGSKLEDARAKVKEFAVEYDRRLNEANARAALDRMSEPEKLALAQIVNTEGIKSEESVHNG